MKGAWRYYCSLMKAFKAPSLLSTIFSLILGTALVSALFSVHVRHATI
jgi:hypothetical protein